jgi:hypothetical protein
MAVTKVQAASISDEISAAVEAILTKHGFKAGKVRWNYGDHYAFKVEANPLVLGENGVNLESQEASAYKTFADSYGLKPGLLGKKFTSNGQEYAFAGIALSRRKYPFVAVNIIDGKTYFFTESAKTKINALV